MAEPKEPKRPPVGTPGTPLPRLWKTEPEETPDSDETASKTKKTGKSEKGDEPPKSAKSSKKGGLDKKKESKKSKDGGEGAEKTVLKEETPTFDTHEARQRVRIIAGVAILSLSLAFGTLFVTRFMGTGNRDGEEPIPLEMLAVNSSAGTQQLRDEEEARMLFDRAKEVAHNKNGNLAVSLLKRVRTKYPKTEAATQAIEALDRPAQNPPLPLFLDRPAVVASEPVAQPAPLKPEPKVVEASKTAVAAVSGGQAKLEMPVNPAETGPSPSRARTPSAETARPSRPLPKGFQARQGSDVHESGWPMEIVGNRDGAPLVLVPGGKFIQGRDDAESNEGPAHEVVLGTFYVDRHEVTVRQFNLFQKEAGRRTERSKALAKEVSFTKLDPEDDLPVVMVSARDAKDYADWAGKFLPTEAQWEGAARTPDGRVFPWGPQPPNWSKPRAPRQIDPIMSFPSDVSPYGAFDLSGNAWEWTKDWYDPKYYQQIRGATSDNPTGPTTRPRSLQLVVKGIAKDWTVSKREGLRFETRTPYLGFRCVLQVEGSGNAFEPPPSAPAPGQVAPAPGGGPVIPF